MSDQAASDGQQSDETPITATMLYNYVRCPHRVTMDLFGDATERDPESDFIKLLWEKGNAFEEQLIEALNVPFTDLSGYAGDEKEGLTLAAIERGDPLIYGGRISADDLLGEPDLLQREGDGYVAGDIKSGAGEEGASEDTDGKPKKHYAVELALYQNILEWLGRSGGRTPFIWDVHGEEVPYDLDAERGKRKPTTLWNDYQSILSAARAIATQGEDTLPALAGVCKLCHWRSACTRRLEELDDLTLLPELGRSRRDAMAAYVNTVTGLAEADLGNLLEGKKSKVAGVGPEMLGKFQARAQLQKEDDAKPYLKEPANLPTADTELFFDIETDPMRDICYLHGFALCKAGNAEPEYVPFLAETPSEEAEREAFAGAWEFIKANQPCVIYYYASHEKTFWKLLQRQYPKVATEAEIEALFEQATTVDLYTDVVRRKTEWPTRNYSLKTLASYLGFNWRDTNPSGAASIEWYHRWVETGDAEVRQRILDYNEDDCVATKVLVDGIRALSVRP